MDAQRRRLLATALAACAAAAIVVERARAFAAAPPTDFDDAYMFLRYARNLLSGGGWAWNAGEPVNGITGALHLLIVTALRGLRPLWSDAGVLTAASAGAAAIALVLLALACARATPVPSVTLMGGARRAIFWFAPVAALTAYTEPFGFHAERGMDTMSSLAALAALALATFHLAAHPTRKSAALAALASFVAFFARPDNALYALFTPLLAIFLLCPAPRRALVVAFVAPFALLVAVELGLARALLGTALPLAFYAKRPFAYGGFVGEYTWNPFLFLEVFFRAAAPFVVALLLFARRRHARALAVLLIPLALTFAFYFRINQIMGHLARFYFPSLAIVIVAAARAIDAWPNRLPLRAALAALLLFAGGPALEAAGRAYEKRAESQPLAPLDGYKISATAPLPEMDSWQGSVVVADFAASSPGARLALTEDGVVGARAPRAILIDLAGLHDRAFALAGFSTAELWRRRPDAIWLPHWDYTQMIRELLDDDAFWRDYDFYPDAFTYGFALRRDAPEPLRVAFDRLWRASYPESPRANYRAERAPKTF